MALHNQKYVLECITMKDAYIILCHCSPWQINELSAYLSGYGHDVYIQVDSSSGISGDILTNEHVHLVPDSVKIEWADWSIVQATLMAIKALVNKGKTYRYVHLLSGQCLPAMAQGRMDMELDKAYRNGVQFMECVSLPRSDKWGRDGGIHRVGTWYPRWIVSKYSPWHKWFWWYTNKWIRLRLRRPLYFLFKPFYGGAQWWSLTGECVSAIAEYAERHPLFRYFFHHTFCSDELFFQTCIMRTKYNTGINADNRRFLKWPFTNAPSPCDIQPEHWSEVWESGALFARKFNMKQGETTTYLNELEKNM